MILLLAHVLLTPTLLALVSGVERRFGPAMGGLLAGLPLTSGPIAVFAALDHGPVFGARLATAIVGGAAGATLLSWTYARCAVHRRTRQALAAACLVFVVSGAAQEFAGLGLAATTALAVACLAAVLLWWPAQEVEAAELPRRSGRLAGRMAVVTAYVLLATGAAGIVGPQITGLLSPFPVLVVTQVVHLHRSSGGCAAGEFLRGVMRSQFVLLTWSVLLALLLPRIGIAAAVGVAAVAATAVQVAVAAGRGGPSSSTRAVAESEFSS